MSGFGGFSSGGGSSSSSSGEGGEISGRALNRVKKELEKFMENRDANAAEGS